MSSSKGAGPAGLVSRVQAHNYTDNAPDQWFSIDLGEKKLALLTHYSLKHDGYGGWGALRYWKLEVIVIIIGFMIEDDVSYFMLLLLFIREKLLQMIVGK